MRSKRKSTQSRPKFAPPNQSNQSSSQASKPFNEYSKGQPVAQPASLSMRSGNFLQAGDSMSGLAIRGNQRGRESFQIARREAMLTDPVSPRAPGPKNDGFSISRRMARYRFSGGMALSPAANCARALGRSVRASTWYWQDNRARYARLAGKARQGRIRGPKFEVFGTRTPNFTSRLSCISRASRTLRP